MVFSEVLHFFIVDIIKIYILLFSITFCVSLVRSFFPPEKTKKILSHKNKYVAHGLATLLGIVTPFCSCSAIPLFLGFLEAGIPLGVTFSFLLSSPMINEVALALLLSMFGIKIALIYIFSGVFLSFFSGIIIGSFKKEKWLESFVVHPQIISFETFANWKERIIYAKDYAFFIFRKVWIYVLLGVGLGAFIHGYVPVDFLAKYASADKWYAVPLATLIGIPLYSNVAGVIPLVQALVEKGVSIGTALSFMMAVTGLSFPEFMILKKVMKWKLLFVFIAVVGMGIILIGYMFNRIL
jgi:uncharacterized membrane protein YraQ (UPF0718 family)